MLIILVHNDGTGTDEIGNYTYEVRVNSNTIETGEIKEHLRSESWKALLAKVVLPTQRVPDAGDSAQ